MYAYPPAIQQHHPQPHPPSRLNAPTPTSALRSWGAYGFWPPVIILRHSLALACGSGPCRGCDRNDDSVKCLHTLHPISVAPLHPIVAIHTLRGVQPSVVWILPQPSLICIQPVVVPPPPVSTPTPCPTLRLPPSTVTAVVASSHTVHG